MKKFRFRILCAILSVVICLSLFTACGGGNNGGKLNDLDLRFDENGDPIFNDITLNVRRVNVARTRRIPNGNERLSK